MAHDDVTAEELKNWIHPRVALDRAAKVLGTRDLGANALFVRLKGDQIEAAAAAVVLYNARCDTNKIAGETWRRYGALPHYTPFWQIGDLIMSLGPEPGKSSVTFYGVRFEPRGLDLLLADGPAPADLGAAEQAQDKPRVTDHDLAKWRKAYVAVHGDALPLHHAVASAKGFFHDKTVARDRVHDLFPGRTAGRKSTSGD